MNYRNLGQLFHERVEQYRDRPAYYVRRADRWQPLTWAEWNQQAHAFGWALLAHGLDPGEVVAILMSNRFEWPVSEVGTMLAGGVTVGIYPTSSAEQCRYIIAHSDARFVVVDTRAQWEKIACVRSELPQVRLIITVEDVAGGAEGVISFSRFLDVGRAHREAVAPILEERTRRATGDDIVMMVYTSGTTGLPKGACLSHRYVLNSVLSLNEVIPLSDSDVSLSYLPYCHVAERISGLYNRMYAGVPAYLVEDLTTFWDCVAEVRPTIFASVPRFYEKAYARILADLEAASPEEKERIHRALRCGRQVSALRQTRQPIPDDLRRAYDEAEKMVFSQLRGYLGGRVRYATSGGAALHRSLEEFFAAIGLPILQAYGLTENLCVAFNRPDHYKFGTVGPPMPGCEVRIAPDGEILVRSEMMFSGYYKEPDKTAEVVVEGWLHTGDLGALDDMGFLTITGRKKEIIVTSTGKNIAPTLLENMLKEHPLISQAMVYGEGKSYLVALLTLNPAEALDYARAHHIPATSLSELAHHPTIVRLVREIVDRVNARVSSTEAIRRFAILERDFTIEEDELTPTMKVKRSVVTARYRDVLEQLYHG